MYVRGHNIPLKIVFGVIFTIFMPKIPAASPAMLLGELIGGFVMWFAILYVAGIVVNRAVPGWWK